MKSKTPIYIGVGIVAVALIVCAIIFIPKLTNKNNAGDSGNSDHSQTEQKTGGLVGQWKYYDSALGDFGGDYVYTFGSDGSGQYDAAGTIMKFTYTTDGDKLVLTYESGSNFESTYAIDGNILNIKDSFDNDTLYKKM